MLQSGCKTRSSQPAVAAVIQEGRKDGQKNRTSSNAGFSCLCRCDLCTSSSSAAAEATTASTEGKLQLALAGPSAAPQNLSALAQPYRLSLWICSFPVTCSFHSYFSVPEMTKLYKHHSSACRNHCKNSGAPQHPGSPPQHECLLFRCIERRTSSLLFKIRL